MPHDAANRLKKIKDLLGDFMNCKTDKILNNALENLFKEIFPLFFALTNIVAFFLPINF